MQVLLYAPATPPRLQYICHFIFKEMMGSDFMIITDPAVFLNHTGVKIKYENEALLIDDFTIGNQGLLFETAIREQEINFFIINSFKAFFKTENASYSFDIFSACFYLLSRYEEYLPHEKDLYGRYAHENSLAFKENFLHLPLINIWIDHFIIALQARFPDFTVSRPSFKFIPTYDIDMAFSYKHKGWRRNIGSFLKSPSLDRIKVLTGFSRDPFDCYNWLDELHGRYNLAPVYFLLLAKKNGRYDKNILPHKKAMRQLVKHHAKKYVTGIHPSWQSGDAPALLQEEKQWLESVTGQPVTRSRQHYIRFNLPTGYRGSIENEITDDYSMGYGSINGFRASVATSFYWYDLEKDTPTSLRLHPFCFMDANSFYEQKYSPKEAYEELMEYASICRVVNGELITIWHNNFLGTDPQFAGWKEVYELFVDRVDQP